MGLGSCQVDFNYDPDLYEELEPGRHLQFFEGERHFATVVIVSRTPTPEGITITGLAPDWGLGLDQEGPLVVDHEFVAGNDKLSDGAFAYGDLFWKLAGGSLWTIVVGGATLAALGTADDALAPDDKFEDIQVGQQYEATVVVGRTEGELGRLRLRVIYDGRFATPNLLSNGDLADGDDGWGAATDITIVDDPDNPGGKMMKAGPSTRPDKVVNGSFEDGAMSGWTLDSNNNNLDPGGVIEDDTAAYEVIFDGGTQFYEIDWHYGIDGGSHLDDLATWVDANLGPTWEALYDPVTGFYHVEWHSAPDGGAAGAALQTFVDGWNKVFTIPPITRYRAVVNGDFETGDLTGWDDGGTGLWSADAASRTGNYSVKVTPPPGQAALQGFAPPENGPPGNHFTLCAAGEKWRMDGAIANDISGGPGTTDGHAQLEIHVVRDAEEDMIPSTQIGPSDGFRWAGATIEKEIEQGFVGICGFLAVEFTIGAYFFDDVTLVRVEGNEEIWQSDPMSVASGEEYTFLVSARSLEGFISGGLFPRVRITGPGKPDRIVELQPISQTGGKWFASADKVTVDDGYDTAVAYLRGRDIFGAAIQADYVSFLRTKGNYDRKLHDPMPVTPGRTYKFECEVTSDFAMSADEPGVTNDSAASLVAVLTSPGRPDVTIEGPAIKPTAGEPQKTTLSLTPPSGYDSVSVGVRSIDIWGGSFKFRNFTVVDQDGATVVEDTVITAAGTFTAPTTVPDGATALHLETVAEAGEGGWSVTSMQLRRTGVEPTTVAEAVAALLTDLETGNPLLLAGELHGDDLIGFDMRIRNEHNYQALVRVLRGGAASPAREWRVRPDLSVDVGTPEQIFGVAAGDGGEPIVFTRGDVVVKKTPRRTQDIANRVTHVKVIGADRTDADGRTVTISAIAEVPGIVVLDAFGQPARRVRVISDPTIKHPLHAQLRADMEAELAADDAQPTTLELSSWRTKGEFDVGDWLRIYEPVAGLEDQANETTADDGTIAYPASIRALQRTWKMADGSFDLKVRRADGSVYEVPHSAVGWEDKTSATVNVGKVRPTFSIDPQGGPALKQFVRFRSQNAA